MEKMLPKGAKELPIVEQKTFDKRVFPLVLTPADDSLSRDLAVSCKWVHSNNNLMKELLLHNGAVLFRNFPINEPGDFDAFVKAFGYPSFPYIGGAAPRNVVVGNVFTANEAPPSESIPFHHEMAQVPDFPKVLFFYCDVAPPSGGQTSLVPSNEVYQKAKKELPEFVARLDKEGVRYSRVMPNCDDPTSPIGRSWKSTYLTENREEAEAKAHAQGTTFEWMPDGCLKTMTKVLPAIRTDERTGKKTWFNSIIAAYNGWQDSRNDRTKAVTFPNGDLMSAQTMDALQKIFDGLAVNFTWEKGDVVMVDNRTALHARRSFTPPRRILACLCAD